MDSFLKNSYTDIRPWGMFEQFTLNEKTTVKLITVRAGEEFSLQKHQHRSEFWRILSGSGTAVVDGKQSEALPGAEFFIQTEIPHRMRGGVSGVSFLEISFGDFDEEDITRLEDKYGRS